MCSRPIDVVRSGQQQRGLVPLLVIARKIKSKLEPVRAHVTPLEACLDTGVTLGQLVAVADHAEAESVVIDVDRRVALSRPSLRRVIQEPRQIQVEALLALHAD